MIAYLKLATEAAWQTLYRAHLAEQINGAWRTRPGVQIDELGTVYRDTGATQTVGNITSPVMAASAGWHVNVIADDIPAALYPYLVNPVMPKRVYFGAQVLGMPEALPEAGGTAMVERGVGQAAPDEVLARIERGTLTGRLTGEQAADKIARLQAGIAIVDARIVRQQRASERDALVSQRAAQQAIRADAVAQLATLTGAARTPVVAVREAAAAEIDRINVLLTGANAALDAATGDVAALRAARDALLAAA